MKYWQENLELLKRGAPGVYDVLVNFSKEEEKVNVNWDYKKRMLQVRKDNKEIWLGSTFNTKREATKLFEACDKDAGLVIVLGIGNYKLYSEIKNYFKNIRRLVIFEPSREIFTAFAKNVSIRKTFSIFGNIDISFIISDDIDKMQNAFLSYVTEFQSDTTAVVRSISYTQLFLGIAVGMNAFIKRYDSSKNVNINTIKHFSHVWLANQWRNLAVSSLNVINLKKLVSDLPVIVVSAGPSLKNNLHLLDKIGNKAIIIAVGSAIQILHKNGIIPHIRMAFDGGALQERIFFDIDPEECPLLYSSSLYYQTLRDYGPNHIEFITHKSNLLVEYIYDLFKVPCPTCSTGASVANAAVFMALFLGCKKIILLGQDLCFTDEKMHADGTWLSKTDNFDSAQMRDRFAVKDIYGNTVFTDQPFMSMKKTLEDATKWYKDTHFINASEGGLRLDGYEHKRLGSVIENDLPKEEKLDIKAFLREKINKFYNEKQDENQEYLVKEGVKVIKKVFEEFQKDTEDLLFLVEKNQHNNVRQLGKKFDKICNSNNYKKLIGNTFSNEIVEVRNAIKDLDLNKTKLTLKNFLDDFSAYVELSIVFADEFLSGEDKFELILGL